jgi:hypothetical protein
MLTHYVAATDRDGYSPSGLGGKANPARMKGEGEFYCCGRLIEIADTRGRKLVTIINQSKADHGLKVEPKVNEVGDTDSRWEVTRGKWEESQTKEERGHQAALLSKSLYGSEWCYFFPFSVSVAFSAALSLNSVAAVSPSLANCCAFAEIVTESFAGAVAVTGACCC